MEAHDWEMEKKQRQSDEPEPLGAGAAASSGGAGQGKSKATRAKRPGRSTPILHSDVEKLRRERLNYFIDELRVLVPVSSTGTEQRRHHSRHEPATAAATRLTGSLILHGRPSCADPGICESHRERRPKYAVLADATHYIRELQVGSVAPLVPQRAPLPVRTSSPPDARARAAARPAGQSEEA